MGEKINQTKRWFFKEINKTDKTSQTDQMKKNYQYQGERHITNDNMNIKRISLEWGGRVNCKWAQENLRIMELWGDLKLDCGDGCTTQ